MTRKTGGGGRDARQDPELHDEETASNFRVDRVFVAPAGSPAAPGTAAPTKRDTLPATSAALTARRPRTGTGSPDAEIALRRQLSQLQRQVADVQRAVADKDDEIAAEVEKRLAVEASYEALVDDQRVQQLKLEELTQAQARLAGVEQRVLDAVTTAEELSRARDREKELRAQAESKLEELQTQLEQAYASWKSDRASLEEHHAEDVIKLEQQKRLASDASSAALMAATARMRESHDEELAQLRESHEQSLAMLRGELEPKAVAALSLAEERQRLVDELAAAKTEASRAAAERDDAHQREHAQLVESHTLELTQQARAHATELARVTEERDQLQKAVLQAGRSAEQREQHWEAAYGEASEARARLERELAELRAALERAEADRRGFEERLATATSTLDKLVEEKRGLRERLDLSEGESRRNQLDRRQFIAYLENGLALLREAEEEPDVSITSGEVDSGEIEPSPDEVRFEAMPTSILEPHREPAAVEESSIAEAVHAEQADDMVPGAAKTFSTDFSDEGTATGYAMSLRTPARPSGAMPPLDRSATIADLEPEPTTSGVPPTPVEELAPALPPLAELAAERPAAPPPEDDFAVTFASPVHEPVLLAHDPEQPTTPQQKSVKGINLDEELGLGPALVAALEAALAGPAAAQAAKASDDDDDEPSISISRTMTDPEPN